MLALPATALSGRWQETLDHGREAMARGRRIDWQWRAPDMPAELKAGATMKPPKAQPQPGKGATRKAG
jgi:hypothetical protein